MTRPSDEQLNQLLRGAFPAVEVSSDFTLRLWRRLMKQPSRSSWLVPIPAAAFAAAIGVFAGVFLWGRWGFGQDPALAVILRQQERLDLFGNAPFDTLAGAYLTLSKEEKG